MKTRTAAVVPSHRIWSAHSALTCYGPDSMRQAEQGCLTESGLYDRMPGGVSLNLVRDLGMTRRSAAGQMWPGPSRVRPSCGGHRAGLRCGNPVCRAAGVPAARWLGDCWGGVHYRAVAVAPVEVAGVDRHLDRTVLAGDDGLSAAAVQAGPPDRAVAAVGPVEVAG